jgi:non-homologous end joining protein Ku
MTTATAVRKPRARAVKAVETAPPVPTIVQETPVSTQPPLKRAQRAGITLAIGVIAFPVDVYGAVEDDATPMSSLCQHPGTDHADTPLSPVKIRKYCPVCDLDHGFVKGTKVDGGYALVDDAALETISAGDTAVKDNIKLSVHKADQLNGSMPTGSVYYLAPPAKSLPAQQSYAVVSKLLESRPDLAFVGEFAIKSVAALYQVVATDGVLVMRQLARPSLIRQQPTVVASADDALVAGLDTFVSSVVTDYDPLAYSSARQQAMAEHVATAKPLAAVDAPAVEGTAGGVDMTSMLAAAMANLPQQAEAPAEAPAPRKRAARTRKAS